MAQPTSRPSGLVRVTVTSGNRRVDLVLPGTVPVTELVPELARSVGLLDPHTVHAGYRLTTLHGRELVGGSGLAMQGVEDGALLTVSAGADDEPPRVYDDVVEAMADVVEGELKPWEPATGRRTALAAAGLLMVLGGGALWAQSSTRAAVAALVAAFALVTGAVVLARAQHEPEVAVAVAWMGAGYAAVAGFMLAPDGVTLGLPVAGAGGGALLVGAAALVGLGEGRALAISPVVVGAIFLATGLVVQVARFDPALVLTAALTLVIVLGSSFPWLALGATGVTVDRLCPGQDILADPAPVEPAQVSADARVAHEVLVSVKAAVGVLLLLVAPLAVSLGLSGTLLALTCCAVVMLRTRRYRTGPEVLVGLVSGVLGLASVAVAVVWMHPGWRPTAAVLLAVSGVGLLAVTMLSPAPSVRRGRLGDLAESTALLSLLPLLVLATGVLPTIRT